MSRLLAALASRIANQNSSPSSGRLASQRIPGSEEAPGPPSREDRRRRQALPLAECWDLLASMPVGRIVYDDIDGPIVLPLNHTVDGHSIVVRTASLSRFALMADGGRVAYEVDDVTHEGGSWSVLVSGRADFMTAEEVDALTTRPQPFADGDRSLYVRVTPRVITGQRLCP